VPTLRELNGYLTKYRERVGDPAVGESVNQTFREYHHVATLAEADGVWFLCPKCFAKNAGARGTHMVGVGFAGHCPAGSYMKGLQGNDVRWQVSGTGLDDLVLTPSIQLLCNPPPPPGFCAWHGFVGSSGVPPGSAA
jgi:hypothetical protein